MTATTTRPAWRVYVARSGREVRPGDLVTDFDGGDAVFVTVTRGPSGAKSALIVVRLLDGSQREIYAHLYGLAVTSD
jgi:hypothetical protein